MKTIIISLFFIPFSNCISQNIEKLKNQEVLFVYFENHKDLNFYKEKINSSNEIETIYYNYFFKNFRKVNNCDKDLFHFWLRYSNYDDFDAMFEDKRTLKLTINEKFLKNNKDIIITNKFINQIGYYKISNLFNNARRIFLIDETEIINKEIILKEVRYSYEAEE